MANALATLIQRRNLGFAGPEGELLNDQSQNMGSPMITNNSLASMMQPQNYIQRTGGQRIDVGPSAQNINFAGGSGLRDQQGNITSYTQSGDPVTMTAQDIAAFQAQGQKARELKKLQDQAMMHELQVKAGLVPKEAPVDQWEHITTADGSIVQVNKRTGETRNLGINGMGKGGQTNTRTQDATDAMTILQQAAPLVDQSTHSGLGNLSDIGAGFFGMSTEGAKAADQLKVLGGALVSKMPKMSGPQSDKDVLLYKEMAGRLGDPTIPADRKKAAMQTIMELQSKYAGKDPLQMNFGGQQPQQAQPKAMPQQGEMRSAPNGMNFKFVGGNPADPNSWQRQ